MMEGEWRWNDEGVLYKLWVEKENNTSNTGEDATD